MTYYLPILMKGAPTIHVYLTPGPFGMHIDAIYEGKYYRLPPYELRHTQPSTVPISGQPNDLPGRCTEREFTMLALETEKPYQQDKPHTQQEQSLAEAVRSFLRFTRPGPYSASVSNGCLMALQDALEQYEQAEQETGASNRN